MGPKATRKNSLIAVVAAALILAGAFAGLWLTRGGISVDGGAILQESNNSVTVRCLSPDVTLKTSDFRGVITFTNAFQGSEVQGLDGSISRNGTTISFKAPGGTATYRLVAPTKTQFKFAVIGDSQGHNDILERAIETMAGVDFVIHCGDLTPTGTGTEYSAAEETLNLSSAPVFITPGNHDIKNGGVVQFKDRFGPTSLSFDYGGVRFALVDSSDLSISTEEIEWLRGVFEGANEKILITHAPSYDPWEGNHTLDPASCDRVQDFVLEEHVNAVFTGHIHAFNQMVVDGTCFTITGGGGGSLLEGVHHFVNVSYSGGNLSYEKVDLESNFTSRADVMVSGHGMTVNLTFDQLMGMAEVEGNSSYENLYGNLGGTGYYSGVEIRLIVELVGGMQEGEILRVTSSDGYYQEFGYLNVYPNQTWLELQGSMILALELNGLPVPDWQDGPRIAMLPADELYGNLDCGATSYPDQGYNLYPSAGARWVKNVAQITVEGSP
jgi:predicted phosphodiesterase